MPTYLDEISPRSLTKTRTITFTNSEGREFPIEVTYRPNMLTSEPLRLRDDDPLLADEEDDAGRDSMREAISLCEVVVGSDLVGPLTNRAGETVVERDAPIPWEPKIIRCLPLVVRVAIIQGIREIEFPNANGSRRSRRRS